MKSQKATKTLVFAAALIILTLGFYDNMWMAARRPWFDNFANGTESFIVARMAKSKQDGIFSAGGLVGKEQKIPDGKDVSNYQFEIYYNNIPIQHYLPYRSTPAIQGILFSTLDQYLGLPARTNVKLIRLIAAVFSASILAVFLIWVLDIFGLLAALMSLLMIMLSPWITISGGNLHWIFGIIFLPFLIPLFILHREYKGGTFSLPLWIFGIAFGVLLKCLFNGYELITTTLVMVTIPVFFYALLMKWKPRLFIKRFIAASCAGILGVVASMVILSVQIAQVDGGMLKGFEHIQKRFIFRTYPKTDSIEEKLPRALTDKTKTAMTSVLTTYLESKAFHVSTKDRDYTLSFGSLLLIFAVISAIILIRTKNGALPALTITSWISILAPLSWFIIFKSHSILHPFLNPLAWYLPTTLLIFVNIASSLECWQKITGFAEVQRR